MHGLWCLRHSRYFLQEASPCDAKLLGTFPEDKTYHALFAMMVSRKRGGLVVVEHSKCSCLADGLCFD